MAFTLEKVVPWGRSFDEYRRMFALTDADLQKQILACADGPASFNAELTAAGGTVTSCDPLYQYSVNEIRQRIDDTSAEIIEQTKRNMDKFVWSDSLPDVDALARHRLAAMERFLGDYETGRKEGRYVAAELPDLRFDLASFNLAVCSHFLFLYSEQLSARFHLNSIRNMIRVAEEVRIFPLLELGGQPSRHLESVATALRDAGYAGVVDDGGQYETAGQIQALENPWNERTTFSYDNAGRRTVKKLANGTRASMTYDDANELTVLTNMDSTGSYISRYDYKYDAVGNRTEVLEVDASRVTWGYDGTNQLLAEHRTGTVPFRNTFTYDAAQNRLAKNETGAITTSIYDAANQLETAVDSTGTTTYTFDANGNQELVAAPNGDRTTTTWDYENQPTKIMLPTGTINTSTYNADNLRIELQDSTGTKRFVWDGQQYLVETDGTNATQAVWTNEPNEFTKLLTQRRDGATQFPHFDVLGSTRQLTDASESITDTWLYDAWGNVVAHAGVTIFPLQFVGMLGYFYDPDTKTFCIIHRIYEPETGRWWSVDPIGITFSQNLYSYAGNAPVNFIDLFGLQPLPIGKFTYIPGRGVFDIVRIESDYSPAGTKKSVPTEMGSSITLQWKPNVSRFHLGPPNEIPPVQCCLCEEVGFVQVIETEMVYNSPIFGISLAPTRFFDKWHLDRGIPYPFPKGQTSRAVCPVKPDAITKPQLTDDPGPEPKRKISLGGRLPLGVIVTFTQEAEACVVCLDGRESMFLGANKTHVYGCITWSHHFKRTGSDWKDDATGFKVSRFIEKKGGTTTVPDSAVYSANNSAGSKPSNRFLSILAKEWRSHT